MTTATETNRATRISWYRTPISRDLLNELNQRSDWRGLVQTVGFLSVLTLTGAGAWFASVRLSWPWFLLALLAHGTVYGFVINGFHELCHRTVFRTRWLNAFFLNVYSFIGWYNPVLFRASHSAHHKYTLHPPDDLEVVLPSKLRLKDYIKFALVNPWRFGTTMKRVIRHCRGRVEEGWNTSLFPPGDRAGRQRLFRFDRFLLGGHAALAAISLYSGHWQPIVLITLGSFYGGWLFFLCNTTQHIGLSDQVDDFRLCTRTILLGPFVGFLYWHMHYHIEHHMYAAVPCYRLKRLHQAVAHDLPPCSRGLVANWRQIIAILRRQKVEPGYQFVPELPSRQQR